MFQIIKVKHQPEFKNQTLHYEYKSKSFPYSNPQPNFSLESSRFSSKKLWAYAKIKDTEKRVF